jgi:hypothetical protein
VGGSGRLGVVRIWWGIRSVRYFGGFGAWISEAVSVFRVKDVSPERPAGSDEPWELVMVRIS